MDWDRCVTDKGVATMQCIPIVMQNLINTALVFSGTVALIFAIISGYQLIRSEGDTKKVQEAKGTLTYAILGLVVIFSSFFIINVVAFGTGVSCIKMIGFSNCK